MTVLLVIDIGNTNVSLGIFDYTQQCEPEPRAPLAHQYAPGADLRRDRHSPWRALLQRRRSAAPPTSTDVIISSVVPPLLPIWERVCTKLLSTKHAARSSGPGIRTGMPVRYENPREVGADRIVNALAAFEMFGGPVIAVDFGTATTFDCVSKRGEIPGRRDLPRHHFDGSAVRSHSMPQQVEIARPRSVIGKTTTGALQSGLLYGLRASSIQWSRASAASSANTRRCRHRRPGRTRRHRMRIDRTLRAVPDAGSLRMIFEKNRSSSEPSRKERP